jgi:hypothetical protein
VRIASTTQALSAVLSLPDRQKGLHRLGRNVCPVVCPHLIRTRTRRTLVSSPPIISKGGAVIDFLLSVAGIVIGGLITWYVSLVYYRRAGAELREEAAQLRSENAELRRLTDLILDGLHHGHVIDLKRDPAGRPQGINITITPLGAAPTIQFSAPQATLTSTAPAK